MKAEDVMKKYHVGKKLDGLFSSENIKIFAWVFIASRVYKMYKLVF
jgi:hypothetical protein